MRVNRLSLAALCGMCVMIASPVSAAIVLTEDFSGYADGSLSAANPLWVNHSGTAGTLLVAGEAASVSEDSGSEDAHKVFDGSAAFSSGVVSASFDIVVTVPDDGSNPGVMSGTDFEYFAHFWQSTATSGFRSRTDIQVPNSAGVGNDYTIGISTKSSASEFTLPVDFTFGATVPVTITFDLDAGTASLTAGGQTVNSAVVELGQLIDGFGFRQSNSSSDENVSVDNLVVTHTAAVPEPTSIALLVAGLIAAVSTRRK